MIGHWKLDRIPSAEAGIVPYIYVDSVDSVNEKITTNGGVIVKSAYPEGNLWVSTVRDPSGNLLGIWQRGPRV
jgi:predicted enzyme related to lactoylglutathione lyase